MNVLSFDSFIFLQVSVNLLQYKSKKKPLTFNNKPELLTQIEITYFFLYIQQNATNNTANVPATPEHKLRDLAAVVVGICAGILVVIIVLTAIVQFQSNIVSFFASLKFRRPEKDVEMREPRKLSINPEAREGTAAPS